MTGHDPATVAETHISTLFFVDDLVLKRKKPVLTGFVDFRDAASRLAACRREVELNRRLAPDVYLGVADVSMEGEVIDHMVVMRRLPPSRRLTALLDSPAVHEHLASIADLVADFHQGAGRGPEIDRSGTTDFVADLWRSGVDQLDGFVPEVLDGDDVAWMRGAALEYLAGRRPLFDERIRAGRIVDGHGDLQCEDVFCMDDGPRILDCLEFDDHLRWGDVAADVAFLAMDLERLGHPELVAELVDRYRDRTGDSWPASLLHHYVAYRAHVRSKVACLRHDQGDADAAEVSRSLHRLALDHLRAGRVTVTLVGGTPGCGKSTLARGLAELTGAVVLSSDVVRDEVVPRDAAPGEARGDGAGRSEVGGGRYRPELVARVYEELLARAEALVERGERVVIDASWSDGRQRAAARELASRAAAPLLEIRCTCPSEVAARRIEARSRRGTDPSEATVEVAGALAARFDHWPEATDLDTTDPPDAVAAQAEAAHRELVAASPWTGEP